MWFGSSAYGGNVLREAIALSSTAFLAPSLNCNSITVNRVAFSIGHAASHPYNLPFPNYWSRIMHALGHHQPNSPNPANRIGRHGIHNGGQMVLINTSRYGLLRSQVVWPFESIYLTYCPITTACASITHWQIIKTSFIHLQIQPGSINPCD